MLVRFAVQTNALDCLKATSILSLSDQQNKKTPKWCFCFLCANTYFDTICVHP